MEQTTRFKVKCRVSGRHYHPSAETVPDKITKRNDMSQDEHWAANEKISASGLEFRVIMPPRPEELFEMSVTDWRGHMEGPPRFEGKHVVKLRHFHCSAETAKKLGLANGQKVSVDFGGIRAATLHNVEVRIDPWSKDEVHLDTDEANALLLNDGDEADLIVPPAPSE